MANAIKGVRDGKIFVLRSKENINDAPTDAIYCRKNGEWVKADEKNRTLIQNYPISNSDYNFVTYFNSMIYKKVTFTISGSLEIKLFNYDTMQYIGSTITSSGIVNISEDGYIELHCKGTGTLTVSLEA